MRPVLSRVMRAAAEFNAAHPWDHNAHYHRWILRQIPGPIGSALDVGCGRGELARLLATKAEQVDGIDADPAIIACARELTDPAGAVSFTMGNALTDVPTSHYDVITCVAALHHLPFRDALTRLRSHLARGGTLIVVGLAREHTFGDHVLSAIAMPLNLAVGWLKNIGRAATRPATVPLRTRPSTMTYAEIVREARRILPGARLHRRLFWRYTLVWRRTI